MKMITYINNIGRCRSKRCGTVLVCVKKSYYAFIDTIDGDQVKFISFTVPKETIKLCADEKILGTMLKDYVDELWILPAMLDKKD